MTIPVIVFIIYCKKYDNCPSIGAGEKEKINANSISEGHISRELLGKFTNAPGNNSGSTIGRKLKQKLQTDNGKSSNKQA